MTAEEAILMVSQSWGIPIGNPLELAIQFILDGADFDGVVRAIDKIVEGRADLEILRPCNATASDATRPAAPTKGGIPLDV